jgi:hypothetical protein
MAKKKQRTRRISKHQQHNIKRLRNLIKSLHHTQPWLGTPFIKKGSRFRFTYPPLPGRGWYYCIMLMALVVLRIGELE